MSHLFINQLQAGVQIDDIFLVSQPVLRSTTRGDLYIAMFAGDKTGKLNTRVWQATQQLFDSLPTEGFVHIKGRCEMYQNNLQIVADRLSVVSADSVNIEDYLPRTPKSIKQMYQNTIEILSEIKNPQIKELIKQFTDDTDLMRAFCKSPAATNNHHNYIGGLLEHTNSMLNSAKAIIPCYPQQLQSDLILAGVFLHDIGKTQELSFNMAFSYTDSGQMLGHIVMTAIMVSKKAENIKIDKDILDNIIHIILAHHGQYEFGSPKLPMTREAFLVGFLDNIDAKINQLSDLIENDPSQDNWTAFVRSLETKIYRKKVVE